MIFGNVTTMIGKAVVWLTALCLLLSGSQALEVEAASIGIIGGADGPTAIYVSDAMQSGKDTLTIPLAENASTGYFWTAFVKAGSSVVVDEDAGNYVEDDHPAGLVGVGGVRTFVLRAVEAGDSLIHFVYSRGHEADIAQEKFMLVTVDEDNNLFLQDLTEVCVQEGRVLEVNGEEHTLLVETEKQGQVIVTLPEALPLPDVDMDVRLFTDGIATMSLPPLMNALSWDLIPPENAR